MNRTVLLGMIERAFRTSKVVALLGPRQSGKTTLAKQFSGNNTPLTNYFDLEDPVDLERLTNPKLALVDLRGLIVIDEIQRAPDLFPVLRVLVDRTDVDARFLILGSASGDLIQQSSQSLAGRISSIEVHPFTMSEFEKVDLPRLHLRGGFPRSYLADSDETSNLWRDDYIRTYLERDIPMLGISIPATQLRRFWTMLSHYHAQLINFSELGSAFGVAHTTAARYIDLLNATFMIRRLNPWFENIAKRQVKQPKIYFRDSGILHRFIGVDSSDHLHLHPKLGFSWEGFAMEQVIAKFAAREEELYFWKVHQQEGLDLLIIRGGRRMGFEFKYVDAPKLTRSMLFAIDNLKLDSLDVIYPGSVPIRLNESITAHPLTLLREI